MLWIKALHIIAFVSWMAGLLYLPRFFVYHTDCTDATTREYFATMERRLYFYIMKPALLLTLLFGFMLLSYGVSGIWIVAKLIAVFLLILFHISCGIYLKKLRLNQPVPNAKFFRYYNEIPTVLLVIIVCLAVVKPF